MKTRNTDNPMLDTILQAFTASGLSIKKLSDLTGVGYAVTHAIVNRQRDPQLSTVNRLAPVLGLELRATKGRRVKKAKAS